MQQAPPLEPLYVDLDGTLLAGDMLWETFISMIRTQPLLFFLVPLWLMKGKAFLKQQLASHAHIDPAYLPYRQPVMAYLMEQRQKGRQIVLATASDQRIAESIAQHLGIFSAVLASDGVVNLKGSAKLSAILAHAKNSAFEYAGDTWADLAIWQRASRAIIVQPSRRLQARVKQTSTTEVITCPQQSGFRTLARMLRVHQWAKNVLLLVPLLLAHKIADLGRLLSASLAFISFSLAASAAYIANDLLDVQNDRQHPQKRRRPLAAGFVPIPIALASALLAFALGFGIAGALLPRLFLGFLGLYWITTVAYSFALKRVAILDVVVLAGLYTLRVVAGAVAVDVLISPWFLAFSMFLFLSLAFVKRYAELRMAEGVGGDETFLAARGYQAEDLDLLRSIGAASGYVAIAVFALYINSPEVHLLYRQPAILWLLVPLLLYWVTRIWFLTHRGCMHDDPVVFALTDFHSYVVVGLICVLLFAAAALKL